MSALICLKDATAWLRAQPHPLQPVLGPAREAWQRRLIEASLLHAAAALEELVSSHAQACPTSAPDLAHPGAAVGLRIRDQVRQRGGDGQLGPWGPGKLVEPWVSALPQAATDPGQALHVELSTPAHKLPLPPVLQEAFGTGVLARALQDQANAAVFFCPAQGLASSLASQFSPEHPWAAELAASALSATLPVGVPTPVAPRL